MTLKEAAQMLQSECKKRYNCSDCPLLNEDHIKDRTISRCAVRGIPEEWKIDGIKEELNEDNK